MLRRHCAVLAVLTGLSVCAPAVATTAASLDVEVSIAPSAEYEGGYRCDAVVRDGRSGEVLSAPTIVFRRGEEAQTTSEMEGGGVVRLSVLVAADGSEASYLSELVVDGEVVASQRATVRL